MFEVDVQITDVQQLYGYQLAVQYPESLKFVGVTAGTFLSKGGTANTFSIDPDSREAGTIKNIVETLTGEGATSGSGLLTTLRFLGRTEGNGAITMTAAQLSNSAVQEIPVALAVPLSVAIAGKAPAYETPARVPETQIKPMSAKPVPGEQRSLFSLFLLLAVVAVIGIGGYAYYHAQKSHPIPDAVQPIVAYVRSMRERGYDEATILQQLKNAGWPDEHVHRALSS